MGHKTKAIALLCVSMVLMVVAAVMGVMRFTGGGAQTAEAAPAPVESGSQGLSAPSPESPAEETEPQEPSAPTSEPAPTLVPTPTPLAGPDVPEQSAAVTAEYFNDAGFLGNSILSQLWYYDNEGLMPDDESHWAWSDGLTILGAAPYAAQLSGQKLGKIYVEFGINELNYDKDALRTAYNTVIDQLQSDHPDAIIYLISVTPVSAWCDANRDFKRSGVISYNDMLRDIAKQQNVWYLDVYPVLCGEDGYLPSDVTNDGVHFNGAHCQYWFDYMKTHYIPDGKSPTVPIETPVPEPAEGETTPAAAENSAS